MALGWNSLKSRPGRSILLWVVTITLRVPVCQCVCQCTSMTVCQCVSVYTTPWTDKLYRYQSKMSSSKKLTCKGTLRQAFIRVYRLEIQSVMLVFSSYSSFVYCCVGDHVLQEFYTVFLIIFRNQKLLDHRKQKHLPQSPSEVNF